MGSQFELLESITTRMVGRRTVPPPTPTPVIHREEPIQKMEVEHEAATFHTIVFYILVAAVAEYVVYHLQFPFFSFLFDVLGIVAPDDCIFDYDDS